MTEPLAPLETPRAWPISRIVAAALFAAFSLGMIAYTLTLVGIWRHDLVIERDGVTTTGTYVSRGHGMGGYGEVTLSVDGRATTVVIQNPYLGSEPSEGPQPVRHLAGDPSVVIVDGLPTRDDLTAVLVIGGLTVAVVGFFSWRLLRHG